MLRKMLMGITVLALLAPIASAQTVDELIAKNIQAKGGLEKLMAVKSQRATGKMLMGQMEIPFIASSKRPNQVRVEFTFQGMTGMQVYDGKTAWMSMPFQGKKEPEVMPADMAKEFEEDADFDGPLIGYKEKGHTVELVGKEQVEGADAYKLKVTKKGGAITYYYLDAETFLELKTETKRMRMGSEVETESYYGDYKEVGGLMFAHSFEVGQKGSPQRQKRVMDKVELNPEIDNSLFAMPATAADTTKAGEASKAAAGTAKDAAKTVVKAAGKGAESAMKADTTKAGAKKK